MIVFLFTPKRGVANILIWQSDLWHNNSRHFQILSRSGECLYFLFRSFPWLSDLQGQEGRRLERVYVDTLTSRFIIVILDGLRNYAQFTLCETYFMQLVILNISTHEQRTSNMTLALLHWHIRSKFINFYCRIRLSPNKHSCFFRQIYVAFSRYLDIYEFSFTVLLGIWFIIYVIYVYMYSGGSRIWP